MKLSLIPIMAAMVLSGVSSGLAQSGGITGASLWAEYEKNPNTNPNIPNCSFAGYRGGDAAIPDAKVVANVKESGATGDGTTDDTAAFAAAMDKASAAGGGAVLVPAGTYRIEGMLHLKHDNVIIRGEGRDKTTLDFINPLSTVIGKFNWETKSAWSWSGGLVWIGPADTFGADKQLTLRDKGVGQPMWEYWRPGKKLASVKAAAQSGDDTITVDQAGGLKPGMMVMMSWLNPADSSLLKAVAGHPLMEKYDWASAAWINSANYPRWQWPVEIASVKGNKVQLKQPIRLDIRPQWDVQIHEIGTSVREAGIEHLTIRNHAPKGHKHLTNTGHNAIYVNRAYDCFIRDIEIQSTENGINLAAAKRVTVSGVTFTGPEQHHHSLACRVNSHDNLFEDFIVDGPTRVKHGINTEWLSSGNVWRRGVMKKGIFDSHRAISFDSIRTDITLANDADGPGGAGGAGPFLGKRIVHWNIRIEGSPRPVPGEFINHPDALPMGAIVGIQGAPVATGKAPATVTGDKGCIIADQGNVPVPPDLYEAQLKLRHSKK